MEDLEFNILNAVTKYNKVSLDFVSSCDENLFTNDTNKRIAKSFISYINSFKSKPTRKSMSERFSSDDSFVEKINAFFDKADETDYNQDDYNHDVFTLKRIYAKSRLEVIKKEFASSDLVDIKENVKLLEKELTNIKSIEGTKAYNRSSMGDYVDKFKQAYIDKSNNPELGKGLLTGYSYLDYIKNGLRPSDLIIIAGETGSGKSLFMSNIAIQMWLQSNTIDTPISEIVKGLNVVYFSLEMPYDDCFQRAMARIADVPSYGIRDAKLSKFEAKSLSRACRFMQNYPYKFEIVDVPRGLTVEQMEVMFEEIKTEYQPDVIFIDYLGLMENANEDGDDWLTLGKLAGKVHEFGRAHNIPIVTAVQLNRMDPGKSGSGKGIGLHRIGRSSLISTHATLIIQIETRPDEQTHDDFNYHIIKNRHGESGGHASVFRTFQKCSIIDKPYDIEAVNQWSDVEDISDNIADILNEVL